MDNPVVFRVLLLIGGARYLRVIAEDVFALPQRTDFVENLAAS